MTLFYALIAIGSLALVFGLILGFAAIRFRVEGNPIVDQIDSILPQTQCAELGQVLFNGSKSCSAETLEATACMDGLTLHSRTNIKVLG